MPRGQNSPWMESEADLHYEHAFGGVVFDFVLTVIFRVGRTC